MRKYIKTPNTLIEDSAMHHSSKRVAVAMLFSVRKDGEIRETFENLAKKAGRRNDGKNGEEKEGCSPATVQQAVRELEAGGYIKKEKNYRYSEGLGRPVYAANSYNFTTDGSKDYTLIPVSILKLPLTSAAFCVLLYLYRCAGRQGRAYPSLRHIMGELKDQVIQGLGMAKSTVIRALKQLERLGCFIKLSCDTQAGDHSMNTYIMTDMVLKGGPQKDPALEQDHHISGNTGLSTPPGWYYFWQTSPNNKITGVYIKSEEEKGAGQFGELHSFSEDLTKTEKACPPAKDRPGAGDQGSGLPIFRRVAQTVSWCSQAIQSAALSILPKIKQNLSKIRRKGVVSRVMRKFILVSGRNLLQRAA